MQQKTRRVLACGYCHRADGPWGAAENSSLAGLPRSRTSMQQMADFKSGARKSSDSADATPVAKDDSHFPKAATDEEVASSAAYFSRLKPRKTISVVETDLAPKTLGRRVVSCGCKRARDREPIGNRIIEVPKDLERFESRDARSGIYSLCSHRQHRERRFAGRNRRR